MKRLAINADDFGFTRDVNAGIVHAHREGVLTSTTLMANGEAFDDAVELAQQTPTLDIGCHLVLVQGRSLTVGRQFPETLRELLIALARSQIDIEAELRAQIQRIISSGLRPSHLDSHKHTHALPHIFRIVAKLAHEFGITYVRLPLDTNLPFGRVPTRLSRRYYLRLAREYGVRMADHFIGFRLTGYLTEESFAAAISSLPDGLTEFMCHPGFLGTDLRNARTRLKEARVRELEALTSRRIRDLIAASGVELTSFAEAASRPYAVGE